MHEYRVYCLDVHGKSVDAQTITASTDEDAIRQAQTMTGLRQCEVWKGNRLVAKVNMFHSS